MIYLYIAGGLWLLIKLIPYAVALFEKEHIRGDLEPRELDAAGWQSEYLDKKIAEAQAAGLARCGAYFTARHSSVVKGPMLLYRRADDRRTVVALISGKFGGMEMKKVEASTRFEDGTAILTCDNAHIPDYTGVVAKETCYNAPLAEVLARHEARLDLSGKTPVLFRDGAELEHLERMEMGRAEAMVAGGFARWADPAQTKLRRTWKGVVRSVAANRDQNRRLVREEMAKTKRAKAPRG